jgi:hypothetical protein
VTFDGSNLSDPFVRDAHVDRFTIGIEKTWRDVWSVEVRMPFAGETRFDASVATYLHGGEIGNLAVLLKRSIYTSDTLALSLGLGVDTPTGSDAVGYARPIRYVVNNQAVHLLPFAATPSCKST